MKQPITLMLISFALLLIGTSVPSMADGYYPNQSKKFESENKSCFIEMNPTDNGHGPQGYGKGTGTAYQILPFNIGKRKLWTVDFYSDTAYLTNDGRSLIAFGPWADSFSDVAMVFYRDGKCVNQYKVGQLIRNAAKVQHSVSHFQWRSGAGQFLDNEKSFQINLMDERAVVFEVATGKIIKDSQCELRRLPNGLPY